MNEMQTQLSIFDVSQRLCDDGTVGVISSIEKKGEDKIVVVGDDVNPAKLNTILGTIFKSANIEEVKVIKEPMTVSYLTLKLSLLLSINIFLHAKLVELSYKHI